MPFDLVTYLKWNMLSLPPLHHVLHFNDSINQLGDLDLILPFDL